jgi:hypothetical protein
MAVPRYRLRTLAVAILILALLMAIGLLSIQNERLRRQALALREQALAERDYAVAAEARAKAMLESASKTPASAGDRDAPRKGR